MAIKESVRDFLFGIADRIATLGRIPANPNTLLLVRVDAIGDYILFRNFIEVIKQSGKYKGFKIILCGNIIWSDLAVNLDAKYIEEFIWIDKKKMVRSIRYRYRMLKKIHQLGVSVAIQPTYSRDYYSGDSIIKASGATVKIGSTADMTILTKEQQQRADQYYTRLIEISADTLFEFDRNREIVSGITEQVNTLQQPVIDVSGITTGWFDPPGRFIAICPSASNDTKKWSTTHYAELSDFLIREYNVSVVLVGSKEDTILAEEVMKSLDKSRVMDLTGKTKLTELAVILSKANLIISNDTAAAHIGAAVNVPVICISRGDHFGRFTQYPDTGKKRFFTIYPDQLMERLNDKDFLRKNFKYKSNLDINSISINEVKKMVEKIIQELNWPL